MTGGLRGYGKRTSASESVQQTGIFTWNSRSGLGDSIACLLIVSSGRSVLTLVGPNEGPTAKPDYGLVLASNDLLAHEMLAYV